MYFDKIYCMAGAVALAVFGAAAPVSAKIAVCNNTDIVQSVALGYEREDGAWMSEGWWGLDPRECKVLVDRNLGRQYLYYRATHAGGGFDGPFAFCTEVEPFTIVGDTDCEARGFRSQRFRRVDTSRSDPFTLMLVSDAPPEPDAPPVDVTAPLEVPARGESFARTGVFIGCGLSSGLEYCSFEVGGAVWRAYWGRGTPEPIMTALFSWAVNGPVALEGAVLREEDDSLEVALSRVLEAPDTDAFSDLRAGLQGLWQSAETPAVTVRVAGADVFLFKDGELLAQQVMSFAPSCEGAEGQGVGWVRRDVDSQEESCTVVASFEPDRVELSTPGEDGRQAFVRLE